MSLCFPIFRGIVACRQRVQEVKSARVFYTYREEEEAVRAIIEAVRAEGDAALVRYTRELDGVELTVEQLRVSPEEIAAARHKVSPAFLAALEVARTRITDFHRKQLPVSWLDFSADGSTLGQRITPLDRLGVYVPGGNANYPSTVLMTVIPAKVAGVAQIALACPPRKSGEISPHVLAAAEMCGVQEIYRLGGAQAIAAFAFGTDTIAPVDKIVGPGNIYVTLAKKLLWGIVGIESLAGPSEVVILSDGSGHPAWIAADLMAQAEHGCDACSLLVTTSSQQAEQVVNALMVALRNSPRGEYIRTAFSRFGGALIVESLEEAVALVNEIAPEHLQLLLESPWEHLGRVRHAGAIFVGEYSTVPLGDYLLGPSHVLPTATTARFASPLGVDDFVKRSSIISVSPRAAVDLLSHLKALTEAEDLPEHYNALQLRANPVTPIGDDG